MRSAMCLPVALLTLLALAASMVLCQSTVEDARTRVADAYEAVLEAYEAGGDVTALVDRLNTALELMARAEEAGDPELIEEADGLIRSVLEDAPKIRERGMVERNRMLIFYGSLLGATAIGAVLIYSYGPKLFWRLWVRLRGRYRVRLGAKSGSGSSSMILSGEVWAVVMAVILVGAVFAVSQVITAGRVTEPFSELGVLGSRMRIGDYPKTVVAGESFRLYVYVGNHMGKPIYYRVVVKLGNRSTPVDPAPVELFMRFDVVLLHGENRTIPVDIELTEPGINQRLIFELWIYNSTAKTFTYHRRWCQLWLNVTAPPS